MYPRNAASPPRIAVGTVVQISDGAVQTSGCTVRVIEQGGAEGDGGGTTAYSTDGVVLYTPTQAETDQSAFVLIAKKTGCIPVAITIVTSASATAGYAGLDWAVITAPTTTVNLSGTTVKTATDVETDTADIQTRLPAALVSGRMSSDVIAISGDTVAADNAESFFDGTGYAGTGNVIPTVTTVTTATNVTTVNGLAADVITSTALAASAVTEIQSGLSTLDAAGVRTAVGLASANLDTQLTAIDDFLDTEIAAIKAQTDLIPAAPASTTNITSASGVTVSSIGANVVTASALATDAVTEIVTAILTTAMTESYNTDGAAPTLTQALMLVLQILSESSVSSTTLTVKKLDGSTTAATFTLSDATTPTSITRAS